MCTFFWGGAEKRIKKFRKTKEKEREEKNENEPCLRLVSRQRVRKKIKKSRKTKEKER